jgi:nucleoside-diphosphate-sugar epimerase
MNICIIGLGRFGSLLATSLIKTHQVTGTTRSVEKQNKFLAEGIRCDILNQTLKPSESLLNADCVVLNIPPFEDQLAWIKSWNWNIKTHLVFISSTSIYGEIEGAVDETTLPSPASSGAKILFEEEQWVKSFNDYTIIRFGGLIGHNLHPGTFLSGRKNLSGGNQAVNLIHLDDCVGFTKLAIEKKMTDEIFNLVYPSHPTRQSFYQGFCRQHSLELPEFNLDPSPGKIIKSDKVESLYRFQVDING